ncbi:conjugal transfer protein TraL [Desulfovibrio sp. ZJ200]|uniref:nucleotide-binding protein n=1 Tax=Desulfovibrio sp. ZJ200 TaxID=2709792 RepID=UPI0013EC8E75|nr:conjugal transfer protein TraL [Desulfovibrio sp. ZJ200]
MATIHFILQGKGGVGKSMIGIMLCQALRHFGKEVSAYDADPINSTLTSFREINATPVQLMNDGNIDSRNFDALFDALLCAPQESHVIVDNGASSSIALSAYLLENDILQLLEEQGHLVFFHTVITGGLALADTLKGLSGLATAFPASPIVVWLNPYFGEIAIDDKPFEEFKTYREYASHVYAVIRLPDGSKTLIGKDLEELFAKHLSFGAGINGSSTPCMVRSRLRHYWNQILACVEQAGIL